MPEELRWKQLKHGGDVPTPRSGHSFTQIAMSQYLLYGGIDNSKKGSKIAPTGDVFSMRMGNHECTWTKESFKSEAVPVPRTQHIALQTPKHDKIWIFGGHASPQVRLNDTWFLNTHNNNFSWKRADGEEAATPRNQESQSGAPPPRANTGATIVDNKIYIFGGHGGVNYSRIAFNDLYSFDLDSHQWEKIEPANNSPEPRGGHTLFSIDRKLYAYGGWNSENQYNNIILFNLDTLEWSDPDIYNEIPRWNHSAIMVEAIPSWKYFIFGGESGDFPEGGPRNFGVCTNTACYLDIETMHWTTIQMEDGDQHNKPFMPASREYTAMAYDTKESRLIIFGGWNNGWHNDLHALNVSKIVGPSYAITEVIPHLGQLSGNVPVLIKGCGFKDANIKVFFTCGKTPVDVASKNSVEVTGTYISETEISCVTPNFEQFGPKDSIVQLSIQGGDLTTTYANFSYFMNTRAFKSLAYGPGLLQDCAVGTPVEFIIQARNDLGENRKSGRDHFQVRITQLGDNTKDIPCTITDKDDGQYVITFQCEEEAEAKIDILFEDDKGKMVLLRGSPYRCSFNAKSQANSNILTGPAMGKYISSSLEELHTFLSETQKGGTTKDKNIQDVKTLISIKDNIDMVFAQNDEIILKLDCLDESLKMFYEHGIAKDSQMKQIKKLFDEWTSLKKLAKDVRKEIQPLVNSENEKTSVLIKKFEEELKVYQSEMKKRDFYYYKTGVEDSKKKLSAVDEEIKQFEDKIVDLGYNAQKFDKPDLITNSIKQVEVIKIEVSNMVALWDHIDDCTKIFQNYMDQKWIETNPSEMEEEVKNLMKKLKDMRCDKKCNSYLGILEEIKRWQVFLPLISELRNDAMRPRHWKAIKDKVQKDFEVNEKLILKDIYNLNLNKIQEDVEEITDQAKQEARMEKTLEKLEVTWKDIVFEFNKHKETDIMLIKLSEENFEMLEENQTGVTAMFSSRYLSTFEEKCVYWQKSLAAIAEIVTILSEVQRSWAFLENLFIHSEEVKKELPKESEKFVGIDKEVKAILKDGLAKQKAIVFSTQDNIMARLEEVQKQLTLCEKALNDFMDSKRRAFPRFYFVSPADLLDILSNGNNPTKIMVHMSKIFQAIETLKLQDDGDRPLACGMDTCVGKEYVEFHKKLKLVGKVETYLQDVIDIMKSSLNVIAAKSVAAYDVLPKNEWLTKDPAQVTLVINLVIWVREVEKAFQQMKGDKNAMKTALTAQIKSLTDLIKLVQTDLDKPFRMKVMCLITMDAHSRDIIDKLVQENVIQSDEFQWQSQLKSYFDPVKSDFRLKIADAEFWYGYEYLGNGPRLVVTPLTDRIYVTATQALHLKMGCAPAGPAGTGKTETTKDLASAMGKACYVFNCSDQMDYQGMGGIFKGLASSGSWGCFDEFNRLVPEVLSVCSVQFKSVTDAIKQKKERFLLQDDEIKLDPTCGAFITMNPGYLGRSELPEGLKALFRPITVVVPDLELICENMLMAEGFVDAKILAKKFTTLYTLCRDLLSKAAHYDWGLRAIKSVLVVAGSFKRAEPTLLEQALLMRALRDFNVPKIVADDADIFSGLLGDLFPGIVVPRKRDMKLEKAIEQTCTETGLFEDADFILKVVQLSELLEIRHCVFVMGNPGAGKSSTWKTLCKAQDKVATGNSKTTYVDLDPKVVSTNELYGVVLLATREWKDGLLSKTMRTLSQIQDTNPKWIILDGDLDANWIESMNSVMDDNKILTLASNERIVLKPHMRMIFEIRDLRFATPATVSRAGILFISDSSGSQWKAYVKSWIARKKYDDEKKGLLAQYFEKYIPDTFLQIKKSFKYLVPVMEISIIISMCKLIESIMDKNEVKGVEYVFVFACIWCIGGGFSEKDGKDFRKEFSNWWKDKFKTVVKFPSKGTVFDYFVDIQETKLEEWGKIPQTTDIEKLIDTSKSISNYTVPTVDTISAYYLMKQFIGVDHSPMLVGNAGCGKTQISKGLLNELTSKGDTYIQQSVNFNFYTDSMLLQTILQQQLEKKAGKTYAPIGKFKLIYFIDDLNMPQLDPYNTQTAISLLRQHKDYEHWYDRNKLSLMDIKNTQYTACMNPTAGSFIVNPRLQRHFWTLAIPFPEQTSLFTIYNTFLNKHFGKFKSTISEQVLPIIKTALTLHTEVEKNFRKTAQNFHYEFNVRHLTNIFQGLLIAKQEAIKEPDNLIKLWIHESERIYGDRLASTENIATYKGIVADLVKKSFSKYNLTKYFQGANPEPLVFAQFVSGLEEKLYDQFGSIQDLSDKLAEALREYNDTNATMDLVLFEDAMKHVCRITRIIAADGGHALLVGVGGSGKQSLSKLSSFICQFTTTSIMISSTYGMNELKTDLQNMYNKSGIKDEGIMFMLTEGQITNERFLVFINDLLSSGEIADLFAKEDQDGIINNIRAAVKGAGLIDNKDNCWNYYIGRVKKNLHMCLCFSPVGESFRNRARKFPALVNCTVIDWFQPWPEDALLSVASKFLINVEMQSDEVRNAIVQFMPYSFKVVNEVSAQIFEIERRYVYTTPKSFLELIKLFTIMLTKKRDELEQNKDKYIAGVIKLRETGEVVSKLEDELKVFSVYVEEKKKTADAQAEIVGTEKTKVEAQSSIANAESEKCNKIKVEVEEESSKVQKDLDEALPLVEKAKEALRGLNVKDFQMLKALKSPPIDIANTFQCVLHLLCSVDPNVPVDKAGKLKTEKPWSTSLNLMANPAAFMATLEGFKEKIDNDMVPANNFKAIRTAIADPNFTPAIIRTKSSAAGGLCDWILNITAYYDVFVSVEPKKMAVRAANQRLSEANAKKEEMDTLVAKLTGELNILQAEFQKAMDEKNQAEAEANRCARRLNLAQRLVGALGSESERWNQAIIDLGEKINVIIGDVLLASAFVSYVGPFNKKFRELIINQKFMDFFRKLKIPMSPDSNPLQILTDEAQVAEWNNQKLPSDRVSTENGAILTNSERYSLIIDPQLQGITWLREKLKNSDLQVTRLTNPKMVKTIEYAIEAGQAVLIENMENSIDAVIQPVYSRAIIKKGRSRLIKMGDKELNLHEKFGLYMHTKLSNPHYPPEIQAECALINFTVTEAGLEDQLLSLVVKKERPDLAAQKEELIQQQNEFKIKLRDLENNLLYRLANSQGDILDDIELIENLEYSKKISTEIKEKVEIAKVTEIMINDASEAYRPAASRGALVFFLLNELYKVHSFYKFSLDSFVIVVNRAIDIVAEKMNPKKEEKEPPAEGEEANEEEQKEEEEAMTPRTLNKRVEALIDSITYEAYNYTRRGTFERHKLLIATMLCFRVMIRKKKIDEVEVAALIKKEVALDVPHQAESLKFIPESAWAAIKGLESLKMFANLISQMESEALQWRKWYAEEKAEIAELPRTFKDISLFHRLLLLRALRPDRLSGALTQFVFENLGEAFIEQPSFDMKLTYLEMNPSTPIFFVLFPGVDPTPEVERVGKMYGVSISQGSFLNISMGQGQEEIAIKALHNAGKLGHWIMLQNVHLMQTWMKIFERNLEIVCENDVNPNFRCFVSSEPPPMPEYETIPESILQNSIKVANEAPQDLKANIRRAFSQFDESHFERAQTHKSLDFKALLFGLCMFHSLILGRRKFGSQGWSRLYNFNDGDLQICGDVLHNYLTKYDKVPYDDLRYIYGEIMYGGHITDGWDRRTNNTYLKVLIRPEIMNGMQLTCAPGFKSPDPAKFDREAYRKFVEEKLPTESPNMFGLHPNAEIGYLTTQGETLFGLILSVSGGGGSGAGGKKKEDTVKEFIKKFLETLPPNFSMLELNIKAKDKTPYIVVCLQECERMNTLLSTIRFSLLELDAGLKGQLNITDAMEGLANAIALNKVHESWEKYAYFSKKAMTDWYADMLLRVTQLVNWSENLITPTSLWISGLFNPMSFLTAIMQVTARRDQLPLDFMCLKSDVLNTKDPNEMTALPENGAYVHGYFLEGAGWEFGRSGEQGYLTDMILKELHPEVPVMHVTAISTKDQVKVGYYECPTYVTSQRGPTYVTTNWLKMESDEADPNKWILAGVALLMSPE